MGDFFENTETSIRWALLKNEDLGEMTFFELESLIKLPQLSEGIPMINIEIPEAHKTCGATL